MNRDGRVRSHSGYTILETLIFLAVSAALFVSAMTVISGRQARAEFSTGFREFEAMMNDVANDISDGYYADIGTVGGNNRYVQCTATNYGSPTFSASTVSTQGKNKGCVLMAIGVQVNPSGGVFTNRNLNITPVAGRQYVPNAGLNDATSYSETLMKAIAPDGSSETSAYPNATQKLTTGPGVEVACMFYVVPARGGISPEAEVPGGPCAGTQVTRTDVLLFAAPLTDQASGGKGSVNLIVPNRAPTRLSRTPPAAIDAMNSLYLSNVVNPSGGVFICLNSTGTNQYALVKLGGGSSNVVATTQVKSGRCM